MQCAQTAQKLLCVREAIDLALPGFFETLPEEVDVTAIQLLWFDPIARSFEKQTVHHLLVNFVGDSLRHRTQSLGMAEVAFQPGQSLVVVAENQAAVNLQGVQAHLRRDRGIAVPVPPDPRPEREDRQVPVFQVRGGFQFAIEERDHWKDRPAEGEEDPFDLSFHCGRQRACLVRQPERLQDGQDALFDLPALNRREITHLPLGVKIGDACEMIGNRAPLGFRGMCREDRLDGQAGQEFLDSLPSRSVGGRREHARKSALHGILVRPSFRFMVPQTSLPLFLLSQVHEVKIESKGSRDGIRRLDVQLSDQNVLFADIRRGKPAAQALGGFAQVFHQVKDSLAFLLADDLAEQRSQKPHIALQFFVHRTTA